MIQELLVLHAAATFALFGLIWTVQVAIYPLFAAVERAAFPKYHARYMLRITAVVGPLVLVEAVSAGGLLWFGVRDPWLLWSLVPLVGSWISTAAFQVPLHSRLAWGFDAAVHRRLVLTNRVRVACWSLRAFCVLMLLWWGVGS